MDYVIRQQKSGLDCRLDWLKMTWTETAVQSIFQSSPVQSRLNLQSNRLDLKTLLQMVVFFFQIFLMRDKGLAVNSALGSTWGLIGS